MAETALYGGITNRRITIRDLQLAKDRGERWPMLTAYDYSTARVFDEAGIPVLLVGDSASNNVYGNETSLPVTVDELIPLARAVTRSVRRAWVGPSSYEPNGRSPTTSERLVARTTARTSGNSSSAVTARVVS